MALTQAERDELYLYVGGEIRKVQEQVAGYRASLEAMAGDIAKLTDASRAKPNVIDWPSLDREEYKAKLAELDEWIRTRLSRYPNTAGIQFKFPCWRQHPDSLDAATSLWLTWEAAYRTPKAPATDAARWRLEWLPKLSAAFKEGLHGCGYYKCSLEEERRREQARGWRPGS